MQEEKERLEKQKTQLKKLKSEIKPAFTVKYGKRKVCLTCRKQHKVSEK